jgi:thiosulfate/3-mercaptopyruvate sulfurtransferase
MDALVSTEWLAGELGAFDLRVVDATQFLPEAGRDARAEFEQAHIPGAIFMDLAELADPSNAVPNMAPTAEKFASRMQALGLGDGSRIVLYDNAPHKTAARAWWMLRMFGAHDVAILDGGLAKWQAEGRAIEAGVTKLRHRHFTVWADPEPVRSKEDVLANLTSGAAVVVDARGAARFTGEEPETRPGCASGHIPASRNLPYDQVFNADGTYKSAEGIKAAFDGAGVDLSKPLITTCGSGITAAVLYFAAALTGKKDIALYDGSWSEWGVDPQTPKATGAA